MKPLMVRSIRLSIPTQSSMRFPMTKPKEVRSAKIGIVWHTTYTGDSFESMRATYGVDVSKFRKSVNVWSQDAMLRDVSGATMNKAETAAVTKHLSDAGKLFNQDLWFHSA